jgi:hypothetical protein
MYCVLSRFLIVNDTYNMYYVITYISLLLGECPCIATGEHFYMSGWHLIGATKNTLNQEKTSFNFSCSFAKALYKSNVRIH